MPSDVMGCWVRKNSVDSMQSALDGDIARSWQCMHVKLLRQWSSNFHLVWLEKLPYLVWLELT